MTEVSLPQPASQPLEKPAVLLTPETVKPPRELRGMARFLVEPLSHQILTGGIDPRTREYFGIEKGKEVPATMKMGDVLPTPEVAAGLEANLKMLADGKKDAVSVVETGTGRFIQVQTFTLDEDGRAPINEVIFTDVTETVKAEREKTQKANEVAERIAHDIRSPATLIRGYVDLIGDDIGLNPEQKKRAMIAMKTAAINLSTLGQEYLQLMQIETGQLKIAPIPVDMDLLVTEVKNRLQYDEMQSKAQITYQEHMPTPRGSAALLSQVMQNLVSNGIKYGGAEPKIEVSAVALDGGKKVRYQVTDHGPGIPADGIPKLFTKFGSLKQPGQEKIPTVGLGLALVKDIVELHGGKVGVISEVGKGSTFYFELPADRFDPQEVSGK